jgi:hypothetical protein
LGIASVGEIQKTLSGERSGPFGKIAHPLRLLSVELVVHDATPRNVVESAIQYARTASVKEQKRASTCPPRPSFCDRLESASRGAKMPAVGKAKMTARHPIRKACPSCGKPMKLVHSEGETGREHYVCNSCDDDPLHDPEARAWAESPLRPPAK